jgi:hypothetical protein
MHHHSETTNVKAIAHIMAPHTIGKAHRHNSGYEGQWQDEAHINKFDVGYFFSLAGKGWRPVRKVGGRNDRNFWMRSDAKARPGRSLIWNEKDA